jgi:hypothetical protein
VLGIVVFPKQSLAVVITWFVVACGLMAWYTFHVRRVRHLAGISPPAGQSNLEFLRRLIPSLIVAGAGFLLLGVTVMTLARGGLTTSHLGWGSLLFLLGAATLIWAAILRLRRPSGDS